MLRCLAERWSWFRVNRASRRSATDLARSLCDNIQFEVAHGEYGDVILLAYSGGGVLARRAFVTAAQWEQDRQYTWHVKTKRIVLLAALNRGSDPRRYRFLRVARAILSWLGVYRCPFVDDLLRGSDFITNLRLDWMMHFRGTTEARPGPTIVQVRGDDDAVV